MVNFIFPLNIHIGNLYLKDITCNELHHLTEWYNNIADFKYATGVNLGVSFEYIMDSFEKAFENDDEFFTGIYLKDGCKLIGLLKGTLKKGKRKIVWISQILIDKAYQRKGYGSRVMEGVLGYFSRTVGVREAFAAVAEENTAGIRFWERMAFKEFRKCRGHFIDSGEGIDVIVMHKKLVM